MLPKPMIEANKTHTMHWLFRELSQDVQYSVRGKFSIVVNEHN